jgi:hypothetical protein
VDAKSAVRDQYDATRHAIAARKGEQAIEIDLFQMFDNDGSGTLSKRELRRALNGIKQKLSPELVALMDGMMEKLDADGDGEVDLAEWEKHLPPKLLVGIRAQGEELVRRQLGAHALGKPGAMALARDRGRQKVGVRGSDNSGDALVG